MSAGVLDILTNLDTGIDHALATDLHRLTDAELHSLLPSADVLRRKSEALEARIVGEIDIRRSHEPEGAKTAAAYAMWVLPIPEDTARTLVRCARHLRRMPRVAEAFGQGLITVDHVRRLAKCEHTNPAEFTEAEELLLAMAVSMDWRDFTKAIAYWCQLADPDGSQQDAEARLLARRGSVLEASDGMVLVAGQLDPMGGGIFMETFRRIKRELFLLDWEAAKAIHGDDVSFDRLARTDAQRGADALRVMAERAQMVPGDVSDIHGPRPLITVLVGEDSLRNVCETEAGTVLDPREIIQLLDKAEVERVVFDGPSRVIDVGERRRFFTGATRRAVQVRDRECAHPSCHEPVTDADIDHILEYGKDGLTVQDNGRVMCKWHHRWRHRPHPPAA
jgi:hypothetical protein